MVRIGDLGGLVAKIFLFSAVIVINSFLFCRRFKLLVLTSLAQCTLCAAVIHLIHENTRKR